MNYSNQELVNQLTKLRADECTVLAKFIYFLAEAMKREIHLSEGYSSLFDFLVRKFGYSEGSAARRVAAVKVYRVIPEVLTDIKVGKVKLSNLHLISKHITPENAPALIKASVGKSKLEMEAYVANKFNQSSPTPKRDSVKPIATKSSTATQNSFNFENSVEISQESPQQQTMQQNFRVSVTLDQETYDKLVRLQELSGKDKISDAIDVALEFYLAKKDPQKTPTKTPGKKSPQPRSGVKICTPGRSRRHIKVSLRREVFKRDGYQCMHTSHNGQRCPARRHLELDHVVPYSLGGQDTPQNLRVMCSQHNKHRWKFRGLPRAN